MHHVYSVTVSDHESSFELLVRHNPNDHEGVARLVADKLLADENLTAHEERHLTVFEYPDGRGVLSAIAWTDWTVTTDDGWPLVEREEQVEP